MHFDFRGPQKRSFRSRMQYPAILACALPSFLLSAGQPAALPSSQDRSLEEVLVEGNRTLASLRDYMIELEDRFYDRYNELNTNDLHDIHCDEAAPTGTLLRRRFCRVVFESLAHEKEGRQHLQALQYSVSNPVSPMEWIAPLPATVAIEAGRAAFRDTMRAVTSNNPELIEMLRQLKEAATQYETLRRRSFDQGHAAK